MINLFMDVDEEKETVREMKVEATGDVREITAELFFTMEQMYEHLKKSDEKSAEFFKKTVTEDISMVFMTKKERAKMMADRLAEHLKQAIQDIFKQE